MESLRWSTLAFASGCELSARFWFLIMNWCNSTSSSSTSRSEVEKSKNNWYLRRNWGGRVVWGGIKLLGWLGGLNVAPTIPFAHILVLTLNWTSPPSFIQIRPLLPKLDFSWGGLNIPLSHSASSFTVTYPKIDLPTKFHPNQTKIAKVVFWVVREWTGWAKRTASHTAC